MFADDTNFFYSNKNIKHLYKTINKELARIQIWFNVNKLSLNIAKLNTVSFILPHTKIQYIYAFTPSKTNN